MRRLWGIATFVGVLALLLAPTRASANATVDETIRLLNESRASVGVGELRLAPELSSVAQAHAERMASTGELHHNSDLSNQVESWTRLGENVGVGGTVAELHDAFLNSQTHRANVIDGDWSEVGIGVAHDGASLWVVHVFRQPEVVAAAAPVPAATAPAQVPAPAAEPVPAQTMAAPAETAATPRQLTTVPGYSATIVALALSESGEVDSAMATVATPSGDPVTRTAPLELHVPRLPFEAKHFAAAMWLAVALVFLRALPQHRMTPLRVRV